MMFRSSCLQILQSTAKVSKSSVCLSKFFNLPICRSYNRQGIFEDESDSQPQDSTERNPYRRNYRKDHSSSGRPFPFNRYGSFGKKQHFGKGGRFNAKDEFDEDDEFTSGDTFNEDRYPQRNRFAKSRDSFTSGDAFDDDEFSSRNTYNKNQFQQRNRFGRSREPFSFQNRDFNLTLKKVRYDPNDLPPLEKNFYVEHPDVTSRSDDEVHSFRDEAKMSVSGSDVPKPVLSFNELNLPNSLKEIVQQQEYSEPTPIQAQGWPIVLSGRDMVGISQTGSGKTLVFVLPALVHALNQPKADFQNRSCAPQILILAPTRELVQQIQQVCNTFSDSCSLYSSCAYGGASRFMQLRALRGAQICVATPGRLTDFVSTGEVSLHNCTYLVLDEADRMLDMGFEPQIRQIVEQIRPDRQTLMWSATWPKEIQGLARDFLDDHVLVTVGGHQLVANPNIKQTILMMDDHEKDGRLLSVLQELIDEEKNKVLIFAQTKKQVDYLGYNLREKNIPAMCIHGDVSQSRRDQVLHNFRSSKCSVLIATDVAARGLDITDITHVINFDFPLNIEDYVHRIGRTGRGLSATGSAIAFVTRECALADELASLLCRAEQDVPEELAQMAADQRRPLKGKRSLSQRGPHRREYYVA